MSSDIFGKGKNAPAIRESGAVETTGQSEEFRSLMESFKYCLQVFRRKNKIIFNLPERFSLTESKTPKATGKMHPLRYGISGNRDLDVDSLVYF